MRITFKITNFIFLEGLNSRKSIYKNTPGLLSQATQNQDKHSTPLFIDSTLIGE